MHGWWQLSRHPTMAKRFQLFWNSGIRRQDFRLRPCFHAPVNIDGSVTSVILAKRNRWYNASTAASTIGAAEALQRNEMFLTLLKNFF
jgi:hypothetical protein